MNKLILILLTFGILACGGQLTDEQRKKMHEASEQQAIVKITDAEITALAFTTGRSALENLTSVSADSISKALDVKIHWMEAGAKANSLEIEQQLMDAYVNSVITGAPMRDNVQNIGEDSVLYTSVVVLTHPDSTIEVKGTWNVWMSKKQLILSRKKY